MDKKELRTFLLQYRDKMDKMDAAAHSRNICQELKRCFRGDRVMVYLATGNECDPEEYYDRCIKNDIKACVIYLDKLAEKKQMKYMLIIHG